MAGWSYKLTLSYDGGAYAGWQRQSNALAVQEVVEEALSGLLDQPVTVYGASRTDAGVHARGQVAHIELEREFALSGLVHGSNYRLPADVRVLSAEPVPAGFHARFTALGKEYRYRLVRAAVLSPLDAPFAVGFIGDLDREALLEASAALPGAHDFTAFALAGGAHHQPVRTIAEAEWLETGEELVFRVMGDGFLRGMVRGLIGTLLEVGVGKRSPRNFAGLLAGRPRSEAGPTAPAHGLCLWRVLYAPPGDAQGLC